VKSNGYAIGLALLGALGGCDGGSRGAENATASAQSVAAASPDIEGYLRGFSAGDSDACFGEAALGQAAFRNRSDASVAAPPARVLVAVDASGSMAGRVSGRRKLELAQAAVRTFIQGLPAAAEAGLLVFGQAGDNTPRGKAASCASVDLAVPLSRDRSALAGRVSAIKAIG
jgi:Ca-activated chloride channel family protein